MASPSQPLQDFQLRLANMRAELMAPAQAIRNYCDLLRDEARSGGHGDSLADLAEIGGSADELYAMVEALLDPALARKLFDGTDMAAAKRRLRHDLAHPITAIKGYGELMLAEASGEGARGLRETLLPLLSEVGRLLARIDTIVEFHPTARMRSDLARSFERAEDAVRDASQPGRILVVDDDATSRDLMARRLVLEGHEVVLAENGVEALQRLETAAVDLILLDLLMPVKNGFDVLLELKGDARLRDIPVVMVTAVDEDDTIRACIEAGAEGYLAKHVEPAMLRARINGCLGRKRWREAAEGAVPESDPASPMAPPRPPGIELSARDLALREELEGVLREAEAMVARNCHLTSRGVAHHLARSGEFRFKEATLREIIGRRYPPLRRLGILGGT